MERHKVYYREGNGASSQRLQAVWSLCVRLSLLNPSHHFHSTYTNRLFFLVVQVDIILWIRPNPILEIQHTFLPPKCCELRAGPNRYCFHCFTLGPTLGPLRSLGVHQCCWGDLGSEMQRLHMTGVTMSLLFRVMEQLEQYLLIKIWEHKLEGPKYLFVVTWWKD